MILVFVLIGITAFSLIISIVADIAGRTLVAQLAVAVYVLAEFIVLLCLIVNAVTSLGGLK